MRLRDGRGRVTRRRLCGALVMVCAFAFGMLTAPGAPVAVCWTGQGWGSC